MANLQNSMPVLCNLTSSNSLDSFNNSINLSELMTELEDASTSTNRKVEQALKALEEACIKGSPRMTVINLIGLVAWFPRWQLLLAGLLKSQFLPRSVLAAVLDTNSHIHKPQAPHQWTVRVVKGNCAHEQCGKLSDCLQCRNCKLLFCERDLLSKSCTEAWMVPRERAYEMVNASLLNY